MQKQSILVLAMVVTMLAGSLATAEILQVLASNSYPTYTTSSLENGQEYLIEVSGTYCFNWNNPDDDLADAEWASVRFGWEPWGEYWRVHENPPHTLDLHINYTGLDWLGTTDGVHFTPHTYSPSHIYRTHIWGGGEQIHFVIDDPWRPDNTGYLTVEITEVRELLLLDPNGGESLTSGEAYPIKWSSTGSISDVLIEYSTDNGSSWLPVHPNNTGNDGLYNWLVPAEYSSQCLVRVSDANDPNISDISNGVFTIQPSVAGYIVAWGDNSIGQCDVPDGNDFVAISAGSQFSLALRTDGSLTAWGYNNWEQCKVPSGNDFVSISTGKAHSLALRAVGSIVAWGQNSYGQCDVPIGNDFVEIATGFVHSLAIRSDGSLVAWGWNDNGQCDVPTGNNFIAVTAGNNHSVALMADGTLVAWGLDEAGMLDVPEGNDFTAISAGNSFTIALKSDGSLVAWGYNGFGRCAVPAGNNFIKTAAGFEHGLALRSDGTLAGWGRNQAGQASVPDGNDFVAVSAGNVHNLALVYESIIGDYIDWYDLAAFCDRWLNDGCLDANYWCYRADVDRSGDVDFADYAWLGYYWENVAPEPNVASSPEPNDLATNVGIAANLNWIAGVGTAAHGVYFGTNATPDANDFQGYQTGTTFDLGTLAPATTYYWQIDEVGLGGTALGDVWSFTTAPAPGQTSNPNPTDTETGVNIYTYLSWTAGSDTTSFDVYFGTNPTPDVNGFWGNLWPPSTIWQTGPLEYETTCYWRIDALGPGGTTTGAVWSFTTMIDPNLVGRWWFNETSGIIAYDSSNKGNHGTLFDGFGAGLVWEPNEGALNFDGSNNLSRVVIPTAGMTTTAGTVAIWANLAEPQIRGGGRVGQAYFFGCDNGGINKLLLYMSNSDTQLDMKIGNHGENNLLTLSTETWYHMALTWNAGTYAIYVDGSPLDTGTYAGLSSLPSTADIGNNGDSHTQSLHGLMGEVQVYDKALPADEIQELYLGGPN